jgi:hypothetical protein
MALWWRMYSHSLQREVYEKLDDNRSFVGFYDDDGTRLPDDLGVLDFVSYDPPVPEWATD